MSYGTCQSCLHWSISRPLELRGSCSVKRHRRHASAGCADWHPIFRKIGELRRSLTKDYRDWLHIAAVRRLFSHKKISADKAKSLLKTPSVMDCWQEYIEHKQGVVREPTSLPTD